MITQQNAEEGGGVHLCKNFKTISSEPASGQSPGAQALLFRNLPWRLSYTAGMRTSEILSSWSACFTLKL